MRIVIGTMIQKTCERCAVEFSYIRKGASRKYCDRCSGLDHIYNPNVIASAKRGVHQGNPCRRGHIGLRIGRACIECKSERQQALQAKVIEAGKSTRHGKPCNRGHDGLRYIKSGRCVACTRLSSKAHRLANPDRYRRNNVAWRTANRAKLSEDKAKYAAENREKIRAWRHNRKARKRDAEGFYTADDIDLIRIGQKDRCFYCSDPLCGEGHVDHFTPLSKGGTNWPENLCLACSDCNLSKGAKDPLVWAVEQEFSGIAAFQSDGPNPIWLPGRQWL